MRLPIKTARLVTPWDSVYTEPELLDQWLIAAQAARIEPLVAFEHARGDRCPDRPCRLPSIEAYAAAFRTFRARYPWVRLVTPWNEPNHHSQPTAGQPLRAAALYNAARAQCGDCDLVAGDLLDSPNMPGWLTEYQRGLAETPRLWGLHNYYDATYFSSAGVRTMLDLVPGEVWLTETGGIVSFATPDGRVALPYDETRAEASVRFTFDLARRYRHRVGRVYLYQWQSPPGARFDAGLIGGDGRPRPAYDVVGQELGVEPGQGASAPGVARSTNGPSARARLLVRRVKLTAHGYLSVPLACAGVGQARCAGRASVEGVRYRRARLVNGRPPAGILAPRTRAFEIPGARITTLPFVVPRRVLLAAARRGSLRLRLTLRAGGQGLTAQVKEHIVEVKAPRNPRVFSRGRRAWERR
jgi:hypothetical protein